MTRFVHLIRLSLIVIVASGGILKAVDEQPADGDVRTDIWLKADAITKESLANLAGRDWKSVTLSDAKLDGRAIEPLRHAKSIQMLRLYGTDLSGQISRLQNVNGLIGLELGAPLRGFDLDAIGQLTNLEQLALPHDLAITVTDAREIARLTRLKKLSLYLVNIDDSSFVELRTLVNLEDLQLSHTRITDEGLKTIEQMPRLRKLDLHRHPDWLIKQQLTDACLASICRLTELESLTLSGRVSNEGLKQIARLPNLKFLSIESTEIDAEGLEGLANSTVETLFVTGSQVNSDNTTAMNHLRKCPNLKSIHIRSKFLGEAEMFKLEKALPGIGLGFSS